MLQHSGKLLVRVRLPWLLDRLGLGRPRMAGYRWRWLFETGERRFAIFGSAETWYEAAPLAPSADEHPWDHAHRVAAAHGYHHFVEPDLLHTPAEPNLTPPATGMDPDWPPPGAVSPAWHLEANFTGFLEARRRATGKGVRVAHLDTGYWPEHASTPRHMRPDLGYNFSENNTDTIDPGNGGLLANPGHGTATAALLAGGQVELDYRGMTYRGDFGGAPDCEVVPIRVGPSVVHFFTGALAEGLNYALAPRGRTRDRCDVATLSVGGVPSACWGDAVNRLYEAGVVVAAASGDNIYAGLDLPTHAVVYPSAFDRVITVTGATYAQSAYTTERFGAMQGNWGPETVMHKAVAGYTPNIAFMMFRTKSGFGFSNGTSLSAPQVAAACALWLELYGANYPANWQRVEACRVALFESARHREDPARIGQGILFVPAMLDAALEAEIRRRMRAGAIRPMPRDEVREPLWRLLFDLPPAESAADAMYDLEVAQVLHRSRQPALVAAKHAHAGGARLDASRFSDLRRHLAAEPELSTRLRARLSEIPGPEPPRARAASAR